MANRTIKEGWSSRKLEKEINQLPGYHKKTPQSNPIKWKIPLTTSLPAVIPSPSVATPLFQETSFPWDRPQPKAKWGRWAFGFVLVCILFSSGLPSWIIHGIQGAYLRHSLNQPQASDGVSATPSNMKDGLAAKFILSKAEAPLLTVMSQVPATEIIQASFGSRHKAKLRWKALGEGYRYEVLADCTEYNPEHPRFDAVVEGVRVATPGALINMNHIYLATNQCVLAVKAISPQGQESELSKPVNVTWTNENTKDSVEALP